MCLTDYITLPYSILFYYGEMMFCLLTKKHILKCNRGSSTLKRLIYCLLASLIFSVTQQRRKVWSVIENLKSYIFLVDSSEVCNCECNTIRIIQIIKMFKILLLFESKVLHKCIEYKLANEKHRQKQVV